MRHKHLRRTLLLAGVGIWLLAGSVATAQRGTGQTASATPDTPTVVGKVVAYEAEKSITVEVRRRGSEPQQTEFSVDADKSKIELRGETKEIKEGMTVSVWTDKENPKLAVKIVAGSENTPARTSSSSSSSSGSASGRAALVPPTAIGYVAVYQPNKSLTVEIKQNRAQGQLVQFKLAAGRSKIELPSDVKTLAVGMVVSVWTERYGSNLATRVVAATGENNVRGAQPATPAPAARPSTRPSATPPTNASATGGRRTTN